MTRPWYGRGAAKLIQLVTEIISAWRSRFSSYSATAVTAVAAEALYTFSPATANVMVLNLSRGTDALVRVNGGADVDVAARSGVVLDDMYPVTTVHYRTAAGTAPLRIVGQR